MSFGLALPNLYKTFHNFKLGVDGFHEELQSLPNDEYIAISDAIGSIDDNSDINTSADSETSDGNISNSLDHCLSETSDSLTDEDINITSSNVSTNIHQKYAHEEVRYQKLIQRNLHNNPNPHASTNKRTETKQCPWEQIKAPKKYESLEFYLVLFIPCIFLLCITLAA